MQRLQVSSNQRFLATADGRPFFYLADTAWELFHRLDRPQALRYLRDRAAKRFTVIQAVGLAELNGLGDPAACGFVPLVDNDPTRPVEDYWKHVDWCIDQANALGMYVALLPTWGDKWHKRWGAGPEIFTPDNAFQFGRWIGKRYRDMGVIWTLGGDRDIADANHAAIINRMAEGIVEGDGGANLRTFHPNGGHGSSEYFPDTPWLDFHMWQSGHGRNAENYRQIASDYNRHHAVKPVLDAEPGYEDHPAGFKAENGYLDEWDCRKALYWALCSGACGHTYGAHPIWQFWQPGRTPLSFCRNSWEDALHLPGSSQMQHAAALFRSRPYFSRVPDPSLIRSESTSPASHVTGCRANDGSFAVIYCPTYAAVTIDLGKVSGTRLAVYWFDPRNGNSTRVGVIDRATHDGVFTPPQGEGPDWVLVIDDASRSFLPPGQGVFDK